MNKEQHHDTLRPLFLGFWAPPTIRPQAMLLGKMIPEWVAQGATPVLVSFEGQGEWQSHVPEKRIPRFAPTGIWKYPYLNFIAQYRYWRSIAHELEEVVQTHDVNVIYSFANPVESNIIGAMLAKRTGLPYVAHFSDPWISDLRKYSKLGEWKVKLLERYVVTIATLLTATDEPMKTHIMKEYAPVLQKKFFVVNHCYDPKLYPTNPVRPSGWKNKYVISHIGSFYGAKRSPEPLLAGVSKLLLSHPELKDQVIVELVGGINDYGGFSKSQMDEVIGKYGLSAIVHVASPVSFEESLARMKMSDCLIVIEFAVSYFVAMKVYDYAGADRPIVALAPHGSSTSEIVTKLGYKAFSYEESEALEKYLHELIKGESIPVSDQAFRRKFEVKETTKVLLELLRQALLVNSRKVHNT